MTVVYRPANTAEAHLIRQMLEAEGIPAYIQGEYLQGAIGGLPISNTELMLRVADEHAEAARVIVDAWESSEPVPFDDDIDDADDVGVSEPARQSQQASGGGYTLGRGLLLLLAVVLGGGLAMVLLRRYAEG